MSSVAGELAELQPVVGRLPGWVAMSISPAAWYAVWLAGVVK